jgi:hypothetical protein
VHREINENLATANVSRALEWGRARELGVVDDKDSPRRAAGIEGYCAVLRIGIVSDTRGLLRPEAEQGLAGVAHIIHAGDIGRADILSDSVGLRLSLR